MINGRQRRIRETERLLRPDQGGEVLSEFALEVLFPLAALASFLLLGLLVIIL